MYRFFPLFGISKCATGRISNDLGPSLALHSRQWFRKDAMLIADRHPDADPRPRHR